MSKGRLGRAKWDMAVENWRNYRLNDWRYPWRVDWRGFTHDIQRVAAWVTAGRPAVPSIAELTGIVKDDPAWTDAREAHNESSEAGQ